MSDPCDVHRQCILQSIYLYMQTFLTQILAHHFRSRMGSKVLLSATTGAAANRLSRSASTVHDNFMIPMEGFIRNLRHDNVTRLVLKQAQVYFIDEVISRRLVSSCLQGVKRLPPPYFTDLYDDHQDHGQHHEPPDASARMPLHPGAFGQGPNHHGRRPLPSECVADVCKIDLLPPNHPSL
jgi:hypothetical protein